MDKELTQIDGTLTEIKGNLQTIILKLDDIVFIFSELADNINKMIRILNYEKQKTKGGINKPI